MRFPSRSVYFASLLLSTNVAIATFGSSLKHCVHVLTCVTAFILLFVFGYVLVSRLNNSELVKDFAHTVHLARDALRA